MIVLEAAWATASVAFAFFLVFSAARTLDDTAGDWLNRHHWVSIAALCVLMVACVRIAHATFDLVFPPH